MARKLSGKKGISIKLVTEKVKNELEKSDLVNGKKRGIRKPNELGKLRSSDWRIINLGMEFLSRLIESNNSKQMSELKIGDKDVSKVKRDILQFKDLIEDFIRSVKLNVREELYTKKQIEDLTDFSQITQAARDGIILKQEKRIETIDGKDKEITYDTSMSEMEVFDALTDYERFQDDILYKKLDNYFGVGLSVAGVLGTVVKANKEDKGKKTVPTVTLMTAVTIASTLFKNIVEFDSRKKSNEIYSQKKAMQSDLLHNEQISSKAEKGEIDNITKMVMEEKREDYKQIYREFAFDAIKDVSNALLYGAYINKNVQIKENGKIDGKSLAVAIAKLSAVIEMNSTISNCVEKMTRDYKNNEKINEICKKVKSIMDQMEEKVYQLEGVKHSFDSISISDFTGNFYPKKDYETNEIKYATTIKVPEFSMKRGDLVLLSGDSGVGKSTFLRFLKRGDINNRKAIKIDDEELVDNLGEEYVSFRPSIDLGNETNVLYQITGKRSISELTNKERNNVLKILREMKFDNPNLLDELASKKFMEFSSGQQKRLALSKLFYRIDDGTSVVIVDEPVRKC